MIALFERTALAHLVRAIGCYEAELRRDACRLPRPLAELRTAVQTWAREGQEGSTWTVSEDRAQSDAMGPLALNYDRAADKIGVSRSTFKRLVAAGEIPVVEVGGVPRVRAADLNAYISSLRPRETPKDAA